MERDIGRMQWTTGAIVIGALVVGGMAYAAKAEVLPKIESGITKAFISKPDIVVNENDPKWIEKGNYGENGRFLMDKDGNAVVYAIDASKPILLNAVPEQTQGNQDLKTLVYLSPVEIIGSARGMFSVDRNLIKIDGLNKFDTSKVTDMTYMFNEVQSAETLDLSSFDTSKVTTMEGMFWNTFSLKTLDVSKFNTSNVTNMANMFSQVQAVKLDVSKWNTSNVSDMSGMFETMRNLKELDVSKWDTSNVLNMSNMFAITSQLAKVDVSKWDTSKATNMKGMFTFRKGENVSQIVTGKADVTKFNVDAITNANDYGMFPDFGDLHILSNLISYLETYDFGDGGLM